MQYNFIYIFISSFSSHQHSSSPFSFPFHAAISPFPLLFMFSFSWLCLLLHLITTVTVFLPKFLLLQRTTPWNLPKLCPPQPKIRFGLGVTPTSASGRPPPPPLWVHLLHSSPARPPPTPYSLHLNRLKNPTKSSFPSTQVKRNDQKCLLDVSRPRSGRSPTNHPTCNCDFLENRWEIGETDATTVFLATKGWRTITLFPPRRHLRRGPPSLPATLRRKISRIAFW